ncbi:uncharacterized protein PADG_06409 [Paracoccidioides brasiliensis Pb18]|uniref:Membrane anchor Opy2 N-terminal domain-containing protein n=1 Tax=Paracoccidioides brasiliensis (strain Pb18) TaxID=502780 RepID=C1GGH2_PARBD|nr:uncharacterized protein PADG_06409 [Paracoccidioides brasiliensis Pb18]EEH50330.2 hypothetical protein PADG_06409 [Paracoccidioides brasiliensis Pb18]
MAGPHPQLNNMYINSLATVYGRSLNNFFRRCVLHCPSEPPPCPECGKGETCSLISQSCNACQSTVCISVASVGGGKGIEKPSSKSDTGAIAGGVLGGLAVVTVVFLAWFYIRKKRRSAAQSQQWEPEGYEKQPDAFFMNSRARQSAAGSIASTVLTRASNVIQIAYIPGVTNRSPPDTPGVLVPPVPPLPTAAGSTCSQDQHFFIPGDIRDSVWSEMTEDDCKSISPSLARSSVATTIYRNNAIVSPVPAQQAFRAKAAVVSVKPGTSSPSDTSRSSTPAVPPITASQIVKAKAVAAKTTRRKTNTLVQSFARSMVARPINLTKSHRSKPNTISEVDGTSNPKIIIPQENYELDGESQDGPGSGKVLVASSNNNSKNRQSDESVAVTDIDDSPATKQSPFDDPQQRSSPPSTIPEEGESLTSVSSHDHQDSYPLHEQRSQPDPNSSLERSMSPFDDRNEVKP